MRGCRRLQADSSRLHRFLQHVQLHLYLQVLLGSASRIDCVCSDNCLNSLCCAHVFIHLIAAADSGLYLQARDQLLLLISTNTTAITTVKSTAIAASIRKAPRGFNASISPPNTHGGGAFRNQLRTGDRIHPRCDIALVCDHHRWSLASGAYC